MPFNYTGSNAWKNAAIKKYGDLAATIPQRPNIYDSIINVIHGFKDEAELRRFSVDLLVKPILDESAIAAPASGAAGSAAAPATSQSAAAPAPKPK